jgi:hypothetical protein
MEVTCECGLTSYKTPQPEPTDIQVCHCDADKLTSGGTCRVNVFFDGDVSQAYDAYLNNRPWHPSAEDAAAPAPLPTSSSSPSSSSQPGPSHLRRYTRHTPSGRRLERVFCGECGVTVAIKPPGDAPRQLWIAVPAGCIKGFDWDRVRDKTDAGKVLHCWTEKAVYEPPEGFRCFAQQP